MNIPKDLCSWNEKTRCFVVEISDIEPKGRFDVRHQEAVTLTGVANIQFRFKGIDWADPSHEDVAGWQYVQVPPWAGSPINLLIIND